ncbi:MAG: hypothetical protein ABH836_02205 [Candidatus Omnitrophota bacterium]
MINNKIFKNSLLLSLSVHVLGFVLVSPKIDGQIFSSGDFPKINFLNVWINKDNFKNNFSSSGAVDTSIDFFKRHLRDLDILPQTAGIADKIELEANKNYVPAEPEFKKSGSPLPEYKNLEISGALENRMLLSKPCSPAMPLWLVEKIKRPLEIEVWVDSEGDVSFCRKIISTGSYTLDIMGIDYVRNFKFVPHRDFFQKGKIKVSFKI